MNNEDFLLYQSKVTSISKMLSSVAHKWRQPLNEINAIVSNIDLDYSYNLMNKESLDLQLKNIEDITKQLSNTLDDFRDFAHPPQKFKFKIDDLLKQSLKFIDKELKEKNITCEVKIVGYNKIYGYPNEYMQVITEILYNIVENFNKKEIKNPQIKIFAKKEQEKLLLTIKDNGKGVPVDLKIFEAYIGTKNDKLKGLGLYISKIIIEDMGGVIDVKNDENGAVFSILV